MAAASWWGEREQNFGSYTFAETIHLAELRAIGKGWRRTKSEQDKGCSSPFPCQSTVSKGRKLGAQAGRLVANGPSLCS